MTRNIKPKFRKTGGNQKVLDHVLETSQKPLTETGIPIDPDSDSSTHISTEAYDETAPQSS